MFSKPALTKAEQDFETAHLDPSQRQLVVDLTAVVSPKIGMPEVACRGFWLRAVLKWQREHKLPIDSAVGLPAQERIAVGIEVRENFRAEVAGILNDSSLRPMLDVALDEAFQVYLDRYVN